MTIERLAGELFKFETGNSNVLADMRALTDVIDEQLKLKRPFCLIMVRKGDEEKNPEAARWFNSWLKQNRPLLSQYCAGVAMVAPSERMLKMYKPIAKMMITKKFGCLGTMVATESEATAWLHEKIST